MQAIKSLLFLLIITSTLAIEEKVKNCPCLNDAMKCPSCTDPNPQVVNCPCAPKDLCPPCSMTKTMQLIHQSAQQEAERDASLQNNLAKASTLQAKLFVLAQKFANEVKSQESKAEEASVMLREASSKAQISRNKMQRAILQARTLAMKSLEATSTKFLSQTDRNDIFEKSLKDLNVVNSSKDSNLENELGASEDLLKDANTDLQEFEDGMTDSEAKKAA